MRIFLFGTLLLSLVVPACGGEQLTIARLMQYSGMADASAAVAVSSNLFVAASDEDNVLRLYSSEHGGAPLNEFDFNDFLELKGKSLEADLEGAARIGDRTFWIGSHGRNRNGKERLNRHRLFATDIRVIAGDVTLTAAGKPYKNLVEDLVREPKFQQFHLQEATGHAPKEKDALNIEGLAATAEGHLLIGFRNPIPKGKALIIPLLNPNDVIDAKPARFGAAIQLDLKGRGIRDMAFYNGQYVISAGASGSGGNFQLYRWAGESAVPQPLTVEHLQGYSPEAIIIYPQFGLERIQILSDDGTRLEDGVPGKEVPDQAKRRFRSFWVEALKQ